MLNGLRQQETALEGQEEAMRPVAVACLLVLIGVGCERARLGGVVVYAPPPPAYGHGTAGNPNGPASGGTDAAAGLASPQPTERAAMPDRAASLTTAGLAAAAPRAFDADSALRPGVSPPA